jgi:hypothetical protein
MIAATLLLAACGKAPERHEDKGNAAKPSSTSGTTDHKPSARKAIKTNHIPSAFQGRWALVPDDCGPDASIAKGLMTIDGKQLRFYESVGTADGITSPTPTQIKGRFAFTGEGMDWSKSMSLTLGKDDTRLIRTEDDPTASYSYMRCPD